MKIGIYPGSYNPIHQGHTQNANQIIKDHFVDKIIFIPLDSYWEKNIIVSLEQRTTMIKLVANENILVDSSCSQMFAIDIIDKIQQDYPNAELYYIIGTDNLEHITKWKEFAKILQHKFIIIEREGSDSKKLIATQNLPKEKFLIYQNVFNYNISSTDIRNKIASNEEVGAIIDPRVYQYIQKNNLYKKEEVKNV